MSDEKKIHVIQELINEANQCKRYVKVVYICGKLSSTNDKHANELYYKILKRLDPNYEYDTDFYNENRHHPYQVMVANKIKNRLNSSYRDVIELKLGLLQNYLILFDEEDLGREKVIIIQSYEIKSNDFELGISMDEAKKITNKMIDEYLDEQKYKNKLRK